MRKSRQNAGYFVLSRLPERERMIAIVGRVPHRNTSAAITIPIMISAFILFRGYAFRFLFDGRPTRADSYLAALAPCRFFFHFVRVSCLQEIGFLLACRLVFVCIRLRFVCNSIHRVPQLSPSILLSYFFKEATKVEIV